MSTDTTLDDATGPARTAAGRTVPSWLVAAVVSGLLAAVFVANWARGWLLLLDWAPGPSATAWTGPELPVGLGLAAAAGALAAFDPQLLGWVLPSGAVIASFWGGAALSRCWRNADGLPLSWVAASVGGCVAAANPFVAARVYSGQIGVLWGYALLWWLVAAVIRSVDREGWRTWVVPGLWLAAATACTVHLAVIGAVPVILSGGLVHRRHGAAEAVRRVLATIAVGGAVSMVWLAPLLLDTGRYLGGPGGEEALLTFSSGGPISTLWLRALGGAAFWRELPPGSLTTFGVIVAVGWLATALSWRFGQGHSRDARHLLVACAVISVGALHLSRGPGFGPWASLAGWFWPAGLLREPGKLLMLAVLAPAAGAAAVTQQLVDRSRWGAPVLGAMVLVVGGAWSGMLVRLEPSRYPEEWVAARAITDGDSCAVAVLGDGSYTDPGFTEGRVVAHPAGGFFGERAVVSDDARIEGLRPRRADAGPEQWAATANARYLGGTGPLPAATAARGAGVGWIFVNRPVDRSTLVRDLDLGGFERIYIEGSAGLWRTPGGCA